MRVSPPPQGRQQGVNTHLLTTHLLPDPKAFPFCFGWSYKGATPPDPACRLITNFLSFLLWLLFRPSTVLPGQSQSPSITNTTSAVAWLPIISRVQSSAAQWFSSILFYDLQNTDNPENTQVRKGLRAGSHSHHYPTINIDGHTVRRTT